MKTYLELLFVVLIATFLSACQSMYTASTSSPKAQLGVLDNNLIKSDSLGIYGDPITCQNPYTLGGFSDRLAFDDRLYPIEANKLTTIVLRHANTGGQPVQFIISFYPKAGQSYYLASADKFRLLGSNVTISLVKKTIDSRGQAVYLQVPFIMRTPGLISGCDDKNLQSKLEKSNFN